MGQESISRYEGILASLCSFPYNALPVASAELERAHHHEYFFLQKTCFAVLVGTGALSGGTAGKAKNK